MIVSPLLALMRDQIRMAEILGIRALTINSSNNDDWQAIEDKLRAGKCDVPVRRRAWQGVGVRS